MAGKDRTGIAVAMIQLAAGVHRDDVVADYLLTNTAGDVEARIAAGADTIRATSRQMDPEIVRVIMGVEPEYMESAFAMISEKHGSVDGYLGEVLGVDDALRGKLRDQLVEG
jgi:protein tyrosine/serine phosphatase